MTSGEISSRSDLTYASSTIKSRNLTEHELDLLFEAMYDDYIGGQPSVSPRTTHIDSMQEELLQFKSLDVWVLVPPSDNIKPLTLKWLFKNKHDKENTVIRNKTHLVVRGYRQEEGIDFEEYFNPVARIEVMRYLAFGRHLEEIHMTWAHLEKKQTRLQTNTKTLQDLKSQILETASPFIHDAVTLHLVTASQHLLTASGRTDSTRI
ncbi:retrovirus-related pol polyprotein from transposon TNT 1-94 [Tanacetum coccineum]